MSPAASGPSWGWRLGPVSVAVDGTAGPAGAVAEELGAAPGAPADADLRLTVTGAVGRASAGADGGARRSRFPFEHRAWVDGDRAVLELRPKLGPALYQVRLPRTLDGAGPWDVAVHAPLPGRATALVLDPLSRALGRDGCRFAALVAKNVVDEIVDPLLWLRLLQRGGTLVHAGAVVAPAGHAGILLLAPGGVGKSRAVLHLVTAAGARYLADDVAAVAGGRVYGHPKRLRLHGYHSAALPRGDGQLLQDRSRGDRLLWAVRKRALGAGRVGRRVRPEAVLGSAAVSRQAPLTSAFLLRPGAECPGLRLSPLPAHELSCRAATMLCSQFWDFLRYVGLLSAGGAGVPTVAALHERAAAALLAQLDGVRTYALEVPPAAPAARVADALLATVGAGR